MSMPKYPDLPNLDLESSIAQVVSSIAMEELALSHIINAEGEKIQYVLGTLHETQCPCPDQGTRHSIDDILKVNESVKDMLSTVSMNQMFLFAKLSAALSAYKTAGNGNGDEPDEPDDGTGLVLVGGRDLGPKQTGDSARWIEIARYGDYSLIVRTEFISINPDGSRYGDPLFQYTAFGATNDYLTSQVRRHLNVWFTGTGAIGDEGILPVDAVLRNFTVNHTALSNIGSGPVPAGFTDGFSKPIPGLAPNGQDVAFTLSYGEAANFLSTVRMWNGGENANSASLAILNFEQMNIPEDDSRYNKMWLRSPGNNLFTASETSWNGIVYQTPNNGGNNENALLYPALWVHSSIFQVPQPDAE